MYTADRSKNPTRLAELADRLRPVADDLVLHDEGGPGECLVRAGELLAHPAVADSVMDKLGSRADSAELALPGEAVRIRLRPQARDHSVELAAELTRPGDTVFV